MIVDPLGVPLAQAGEEPATISAVISKQRLGDARNRLPVLRNRRFTVSPTPRAVEAVPAPRSA
jgi:predicted amidohydrolase